MGITFQRRTLLHIFMTLAAIVYVFPMLIIFSYAFKSREQTQATSPISLPTEFVLTHIMNAYEAINFLQSLGNTLLIVAISVLFIIILSTMAAYAIDRGASKLYGTAYLYFISGILIPYQVIFVPIFILGNTLGFVNTFHGVIFFYIATNLPFAIFVSTGFMKSIPKELDDAAFIDGCHVLKTFWKIILPLLAPVAASITIIMTILVWNDFLLPQLFLQAQSMKTLTVMQHTLFDQFRTDLNVGFAAIIISSMPVILLFLFMQKYFIKGLTMGGVKG